MGRRSKLDQIELWLKEPFTHYRYYKQITFYEPYKDVAITSFIHMKHQGPFTFIEVVNTHMLPIRDKIFGHYCYRDTLEELRREQRTKNPWTWLSPTHRQQITFFVVHFLMAQILFLFWPFYLTIIAIKSYGLLPKIKKKKDLKIINLLKKAKEFDFSPEQYPVRWGESRAKTLHLFESSDVALYHRLSNMAIEDAFIECLENAGINTADFRKGILEKVNNYGIINYGQIAGGAKTDAHVKKTMMHEQHASPKT